MKDEIHEACSRLGENDGHRYMDPFTMTLNHGETFGVFDRQGDINNLGQNLQGLFFEGARHISMLEFQLNGSRPLLLSSTVSEENDLLIIDLTNEEIINEDQVIPYGTIHLRKTKNIQDKGLHVSLKFQNFNTFPVDIKCRIKFGADFYDVFKLRGFECDLLENEIIKSHSGNEIQFSSCGRDKIQRLTKVQCSDKRAEFGVEDIIFSFSLNGGESTNINYDVVFAQEIAEGESGVQLTHESSGGAHIEALKAKLPEIETSNTHFDHWIKRSGVDLMALMARYEDVIYPMAGVPWYNTPFGRDGLITAFQTLSFAPFISKNVLTYLARNQAQEDDKHSDATPGKILHEMRKGELANIGALPFKKYYGAADSTFLFIWLLGLYCKRTGDLKFLDENWNAFENCLSWIENYADPDGDGLFEYMKENPNGLDNQCWKDSFDSISHKDGSLASPPIAVVEVQAYAYKAYLTASYLLDIKGEQKRAKVHEKKAKELQQLFHEKFWMEEEGFFSLALDKDKRACRVISSNGGHILATGIVKPALAKRVCEKLLSPDLFTGWGIRTLSANERRFNPMSYHNGSIWPHDNSMIAYGLKRYGEVEKFNTLARSLFELAQEVELARLPELFCGFGKNDNEAPTLYPVSCSPQAWAAGVVYLLVHSMLGLSINSFEKRVVFNEPTLPEFLNYLKVSNIVVEEGPFSFIIKRISTSESTVEVLERPSGWKVSINK